MKISSEGEAKELVLSVLPEMDVRQKCSTVFADSLAEANTYG